MSLYTESRDNVIKEELWKLATRNQNILGCSTPSFFYEGVLHFNGVTPRPGTIEFGEANRILAPELYEEVRNLMHKQSFQARVDEAKIAGLINNALIEAEHIMDINGMLKSMASSFVIDPEIFNIGQPMANDLIEKFKKDNAEGIQILNEIALRALLLKKG